MSENRKRETTVECLKDRREYYLCQQLQAENGQLKPALKKVTSILLKYFRKWGDTETTIENLDVYPSEIAKAIVAAEDALKENK